MAGVFPKKFKAGKLVTIQPAIVAKGKQFSVLTLHKKGKWDTVFTGKMVGAKTVAKGFRRAGFRFTRTLRR